LAGERQFVRLARKPYLHGRPVQVFERAEQGFAALRRWRPKVGVAQDEHQGRGDRVGVAHRRAGQELLGIAERGGTKPRWLEEREVGRVPEAQPVGHIALRRGGRGAVRVAPGPVAEQPTGFMIHVSIFLPSKLGYQKSSGVTSWRVARSESLTWVSWVSRFVCASSVYASARCVGSPIVRTKRRPSGVAV